MPQTAYKQVTDDAGNVTFEPFEVPTQEELDAALAAKKKANDEAAKSRHELKRVKDSTAPLVEAGDGEVSPAEPVKVAAVAVQPALNEDEIVDKAVAKIVQKRTEAEAAEAEIESLLVKHGLPKNDDNLAVLRDSRNPAETAARLGRERLKFAPANAGRVPNEQLVLSEAVKSFRKLGMKHPDDPDQN